MLPVYRPPTGFSLAVDGVERFHLHCVDDVLRGFLNWAVFVFHELYDLILDFVDQLFALGSGHSGLACLLVFSVAVACDCPQTVRQILSALDELFCSLLDPVLSADWTEHSSATMYVVKDSGACLLVVHVCRTAFPCGHRCTAGVLAGTHRCALMPRVASRQNANPLWLLECGLVNVSWWSKQSQRDCTLMLLYVFRV